jgi:hypothetical protein
MRRSTALLMLALAACATTHGAHAGAGRGLAFAPASQTERAGDVARNRDRRTDLFEVRTRDEGNGEEVVLLRRAQDLDFDGRLDVVERYDAKGARAEESYDLDFDGLPDVTAHYEQGELVRKELSHGTDRTVDAVQFFEKERLVRIERDTNRDGRIDLWEYWEDGRIDRIGEDVDADGQVDRWTRQPKAASK